MLFRRRSSTARLVHALEGKMVNFRMDHPWG